MIELKNIFIRLGESTILDKLDFTIEKGDFTLLTGNNGSGKSTLFKLLLGEIQPQKGEGEVFFLKKPLRTLLLSQNTLESFSPGLTVFENMRLYEICAKKKKSLTEMKAKELLSEFSEKLPEMLHTPVQVLSGGEKQCLLLAITFLYPPDLLLLDEHISALDPIQSKKIMQKTNQLIRESGITCLMISHHSDYIRNHQGKKAHLENGRLLFE